MIYPLVELLPSAVKMTGGRGNPYDACAHSTQKTRERYVCCGSAGAMIIDIFPHKYLPTCTQHGTIFSFSDTLWVKKDERKETKENRKFLRWEYCSTKSSSNLFFLDFYQESRPNF